MALNTLQNKLYAQYAQTAKVEGTWFHLHRSISALNAIPNEIGMIKAKLTAKETQFWKPNTYGNAIYYGVFDGRRTIESDYLISDEGIFFIENMQNGKPIALVECNHKVSIYKEDLSQTTMVSKNLIMSNWYCSLLIAGSNSNVDLNDSIGQGSFTMLIPFFPGVNLRTGNTVVNDLGDNYIIKTVESNTTSWRIQCQKVHI